ncbi:MAG: 6-carboxytetrahydropterin synthase [Bacteriovoracaceae bacterium]|nr:6-carboxytetrahydropterin synthase [Bacteriovoracaceae bacterium]
MSDVKQFISTKRFTGFPCTHRQWLAESHCRFVHGYSREFYFEFACNARTQEGWVVDFGGLKEVKAFLEYNFDHTFLAAQNDPELSTWKDLDKRGVIQLRVLPNPSMEGTAEWVFENVDKMVREKTKNRAWVTKVQVSENEKNSAIFQK